MASHAPLKDAVNSLSRFLAKRDIEEPAAAALARRCGLKKADVLILLGNAIPFTAEAAARAYRAAAADAILISGGVGHSTNFLRRALAGHPVYRGLYTERKAEADLFYELLTNYLNVPGDRIYVENQSTNCGDNAVASLQALKKYGLKYESILLMQDPTMQLRSEASFRKVFGGARIVATPRLFRPSTTRCAWLTGMSPDYGTRDGFSACSRAKSRACWTIRRATGLGEKTLSRMSTCRGRWSPAANWFARIAWNKKLL